MSIAFEISETSFIWIYNKNASFHRYSNAKEVATAHSLLTAKKDHKLQDWMKRVLSFHTRKLFPSCSAAKVSKPLLSDTTSGNSIFYRANHRIGYMKIRHCMKRSHEPCSVEVEHHATESFIDRALLSSKLWWTNPDAVCEILLQEYPPNEFYFWRKELQHPSLVTESHRSGGLSQTHNIDFDHVVTDILKQVSTLLCIWNRMRFQAKKTARTGTKTAWMLSSLKTHCIFNCRPKNGT